jgi:FAD/FMN-containing dehydrogenase
MELSRRDVLKAFAATAGGAAMLRFPLSSAGASVVESGGSVGTGDDGATELTGRLVFPRDADYDAARAGWDALFSSYPQVVVFCQNTQDVVNALTHARENDIAFRVRSGRHSLEGWSSVDGGIVIDVSPLKEVKVDRDAKTATVGTGLNQGELVNALAETPFGFPTGDEATVGLGGVTLGGGIGVLSRRMGVACDNLLAVEMVVPSGRRGARIVRADEKQNSDLLWACRGGGGGNFGIATSYKLRIHDMPATVGIWQVNWPFGALADAFEAWQRWAPSADERLGSIFNVGTPSVGLEVDGVFLGPEAEVRALLEPLLEVPGAQLQSSAQAWVDRYNAENAAPEPFASWKFTPMWARRPLPSAGIDIVREMLANAPSDGCSYWCLSWGGAVRTAPQGGTAFFHRDPIFYAEPGAGWNGAEGNGPHLAWIAEFREAMRPYTEGGYVNVPDRAIADWGTAYYGTNFERLRRIKSKYDPHEVFSFEQSIPPA